MEILDSIAETIGKTPMIRLSRLGRPANHTLLGKCEFMNPGGSVKDRIAFHMLDQAEAEGKVVPGDLIVEATGGNTGIGLALAARLKGYRLICVVTEKVGEEKVRMMRILGAQVFVVPGGKSIDDPDHFINRAKRIAEDEKAWFVGQFENKHNIEAHYRSTGPEIWQQTGGQVDVLVAGIGTGGTLLGAGKYLKERKPSVKLVLADPEGSKLSHWQAGTEPNPHSYLVEGIGGDFIPGIVDLDVIDSSIQVSDAAAMTMAHELIAKEALFVGGSAGLIVEAAIQYCAYSPQDNLTVVAVLPSTGHLYTKTVFDNEWLFRHFLE